MWFVTVHITINRPIWFWSGSANFFLLFFFKSEFGRQSGRYFDWLDANSHRRLCPRARRGTRQRTSSGPTAGRRCRRQSCLPRCPENDTYTRTKQSIQIFLTEKKKQKNQQQQTNILLGSYLSAIATAVFFSLSLFDWGALTCATTGLRSLFINSSTLSGFCIEANEQGRGEQLPLDTL